VKILDIDMDFFQTGIHCFGNDGETFLKDEGIDVWTDETIVRFLEEQCGLDKKNKIKGRIVKYHVEAYSFWSELVNAKKGIVPFEVTHIDAHSDLAFSPSIPFYRFINSLDNEEMQEQLKTGTIFDERGSLIDSGNYLLAAIIVGWVERVKYVYHPQLDYLDVFDYMVENLKPNKLFRFNFCDYIKKKNVYLEMIYPTSFHSDERYDYITVALSPTFVKKEMEEKINIIKEYIEII